MVEPGTALIYPARTPFIYPNWLKDMVSVTTDGCNRKYVSHIPTNTVTYSVTGFSNNCEDTAQVTVTVIPELIANAGNDATICNGESVTLNASGGVTYTWNNGVLGASPTLSPTVTSTYTVTVTDSFGNSDSDSVTITVNESPNITVSENSDIVLNEKVLARFQEEVDAANVDFAKWEKVKAFRLTPDVWTIDDGHLTPTMKLRRKIVKGKYESLYNDIYGHGKGY